VKWGMRLGTFNEHYKPRNSIKGQVLADFVAKFTPPPQGFIGMSSHSQTMESVCRWSI